MAPQTVRVKEEKIRGPLRDNDGRVVVSRERNPSFSDDDSLSLRSMDSSRDEMFDPPSIGRLKIACDPPIRLEGIMEGMRNAPATQFRNRNGLNGYATVVETPDGEDEILHPSPDWLEQFAVVVQKRRCNSAPGGATVDTVQIRSPHLKKVLSERLAAYPNYSVATSPFAMEFSAPFRPLLHAWDAMVRLMDEHPDPVTRDHVKVLHDVLAKEIEKYLKTVEECRSTGRITYGDLWTIFKPGELLYRKYPSSRDRIIKMVSAKYDFDIDNAECFIIEGEWVCWDGKSFGLASASYSFCPHDEVMNIAELHTMPLDLHPDQKAIKARLLKRGQTYARFTQTEMKAYTGREGESNHNDQLHVLDRIIINPVDLGCKAMPANLLPLNKDNPFDKSQHVPPSEDNSSSFGSVKRQRERSNVTGQRNARKEWERTKPAQVSSGRDHALTEEQLLTTPPYVPAFDIARKGMGSIGVGEFGDVLWNEEAYEDLVIPEDEKDLLLSIAKSHIDHPEKSEPCLDKKTKGTVICLTGPSGSGKTMAVKAITEKLHLPLYSIDTAEIKGDFTKFDDAVFFAFERCLKFNAILVFHSIDFLLNEEPDSTWGHDCEALLAHHLSTHPGLVFFTCEKLTDINPLLRSRFDLIIDVPALDAPSRRKVWGNTISQAVPLRQRHFTSEDLDKLAETELSGREIKSVVKLALMVAKGKREPFMMTHLEKVLAIKQRSKARIEEEIEEDESD